MSGPHRTRAPNTDEQWRKRAPSGQSALPVQRRPDVMNWSRVKTLEVLPEVVAIGAAGVALVGGIVVLLSTYIHLRTRAADNLSARWYQRRPRRVRQPRRMDAYFEQQARVQRSYNEAFFRLGKRLVPVVAAAIAVFVLIGLALALLT